MDKLSDDLLEFHVARLSRLATEHGVGDDALKGQVEAAKAEEAADLNKSGLASQVRYLMESRARAAGRGAEGIEEARRMVMDDMKDYVAPGKLVECSECGTDEFRSIAVLHGQRFLCEDCARKKGVSRPPAKPVATPGKAK